MVTDERMKMTAHKLSIIDKDYKKVLAAPTDKHESMKPSTEPSSIGAIKSFLPTSIKRPCYQYRYPGVVRPCDYK